MFAVFFQAEDGIRDLVRSRGLGDVYKRQDQGYRKGFDKGAEDSRDNRSRPLEDFKEYRNADNLSLIHI